MRKRRGVPLFCPILLGLFFSCATPPSGREAPVSPSAKAEPAARAVLEFDQVLADSPDILSLCYLLRIENPRSAGAGAFITGRRFRVNGLSPAGAALPDGFPVEARLAPGETAVFPLRLDFVPGELFREEPDAASAGGYETELDLDLEVRFDSGEYTRLALTAARSFPRIQEPRFDITSMTVKKAELINTRFLLILRIDNPNEFPLVLGDFRYELYGEGRFWADGNLKEVLHIPARDFAETQIALVMNFINMPRELLDRITAREQVPYRFTGDLTVETGVAYLPQFRMGFEKDGYAGVIE
jgi:LEA14-like dessication related protein